MAIVIAGAVLIVVLVISGALSSCSMMAGGGSNSIIATSFTAQDADILAVEADYQGLETDLQRKIDNIETDYPGYDEYNYSLSEPRKQRITSMNSPQRSSRLRKEWLRSRFSELTF